ncbi:MAG TPA: alpha/beta fold hydrolase [Pyrinomonadaceae bacterium]|jgi:pimeloyl-ACP methyl ester carboxylesterase
MHARAILDAAPADRTPIVLVHGLGVSSRYMMPTALRLATHARVFAPDLPGFGLSRKPRRTLSIPELSDALAAWMRANQLERAIFIGNSLGAQIIVDFAVRYPERVEQSVLIAPTIDAGARRFMRQFARLLLDALREPPSLLPIAISDYLRAGLIRATRTLRYALLDPIEEKLPLMLQRTLVVRGLRDPIVSQDWVEEVNRLLPDARLRVIATAAHAVNYSAPDELASEVLRFLTEPRV